MKRRLTPQSDTVSHASARRLLELPCFLGPERIIMLSIVRCCDDGCCGSLRLLEKLFRTVTYSMVKSFSDGMSTPQTERLVASLVRCS